MFTSEAARAYEAMKDDLLRSFPGQYALVCGQRLMGIYPTVDEAMMAASTAFEEYLPAGTPILITEIAVQASVRVMAMPYRRGGAGRASAAR